MSDRIRKAEQRLIRIRRIHQGMNEAESMVRALRLGRRTWRPAGRTRPIRVPPEYVEVLPSKCVHSTQHLLVGMILAMTGRSGWTEPIPIDWFIRYARPMMIGYQMIDVREIDPAVKFWLSDAINRGLIRYRIDPGEQPRYQACVEDWAEIPNTKPASDNGRD